MSLEGGCYCGRLRYASQGKPLLKGQCHCRVCQRFSGGAANLFMMMPAAGFRWTKGAPKAFAHPGLDKPVTREFCAHCGTHLINRPPGLDAVILKVGTLDDPTLFGAPRIAMFVAQKAAFHHVPHDLLTFEGMPGE